MEGFCHVWAKEERFQECRKHNSRNTAWGQEGEVDPRPWPGPESLSLPPRKFFCVALLMKGNCLAILANASTQRSDLWFFQVLTPLLSRGTHGVLYRLFLPGDLWHGLMWAQTLDTWDTSGKTPCTTQLEQSRLLELDTARYMAESVLSESLQEHQDPMLSEFSTRCYTELEAYKNILRVIDKSHFVLPSL